MRIGVIGAGSCGNELYETAVEIGFRIGKNKHVLVCGGLGGVMEAAAQGAKRAGGTTIGILPGFHASEANQYIDYPVVTGMSHARNVIIVRTSDLLVSIAGEYGTLSEIAIGLKIGKPVIAYECKWKEIKDVIHVSQIDVLFSEIERLSE